MLKIGTPSKVRFAKMELFLSSYVDRQIHFMKKALVISQDVQEKLVVLEKEKNALIEKCRSVTAELERKKKETCLNCTMLSEQLNSARKEMTQMKRQEKAKLLKAIVKSLESVEDGNTNAHQLFTQLVGGLEESGDSPERPPARNITLLRDQDDSDDDTLQDSRVLVNDTIVEMESEESNEDRVGFPLPIIVPETEAVRMTRQSADIDVNKQALSINLLTEKKKLAAVSKENLVSSEDEMEILPQNKKLKTSPVLSGSMRQMTSEPSNSGRLSLKLNLDATTKSKNSPLRSPSVLSEIIELAENSSANSRTDSSVWKMKPSVVVEASTSTVKGKKLKQMTLSLARPEKKQDISLSDEFHGGVCDLRQSDEERDMVLPSPQPVRRHLSKTAKVYETMEDPDLTVFNPAVTSTCVPMVENSFDRLPEVKKSPPYKYRRDTVRKREERRKLPGQDCDQCAKYYQAAGVKEGEARARLNTCSRHRDKYQVRANTPPGFWDPVLPDSQD